MHKAADEAQQSLHMPIAVDHVAEPHLTGTVLVRPDGVIAWRTVQGAARELTDALLRLLCREP